MTDSLNSQQNFDLLKMHIFVQFLTTHDALDQWLDNTLEFVGQGTVSSSFEGALVDRADYIFQGSNPVMSSFSFNAAIHQPPHHTWSALASEWKPMYSKLKEELLPTPRTIYNED